jgi:quercetin dioxygenase-like cupin family protein
VVERRTTSIQAKGSRTRSPARCCFFLRTSAQTDGEEVFVEVTVHPHGFVAAAHFHPYQTERFEVLEGRLGLRVGDDKLVATPGDVAVVTPRTVHRFWNAGDEDARFTVQVRRALQFESLRLPNPLRLAVIARAHFDLSAFLSHLRRCSEQRSRSLPRSARRWATGRR